MAGDRRAVELAQLAAGLAAGAGIGLPSSLQLWALAGGRPKVRARGSEDPAAALGDALEAVLSDRERRRGAHFTPAALAERVAAAALDGAPTTPTVVDPTCGGGALLLAAGRRLVTGGVPVATVARHLLWGADIDPLAAAVTEAAIALWSGGTAPAPGHVVVADTLASGAASWPTAPAPGFDVLVGNPPFQAQLARSTARSRPAAAALRARFGCVVTPYLDTAALFLLAGAGLVRAGGRVAMVLPQSVAAARDAAPLRAALAERHALRALWAPDRQVFGAKVHVCVAVVEAGSPDAGPSWSDRLASARGVPEIDLASSDTVADLATTVAGFRDEYYGLVDHVREAGSSTDAPLVTSGLIGVGSSAWGDVPVRFAKRAWARPEVDLDALRETGSRTAAWVDRVRCPKVVVASQTRLIEAAADRSGRWVPSTPVVSALPHDPADVDRLAAALCAPPISVWAARQQAGTALSPGAMRVSSALVSSVPLPADEATWRVASELLAAGDLARFSAAATEMYGLHGSAARTVRLWWTARLPARALAGDAESGRVDGVRAARPPAGAGTSTWQEAQAVR